ncbi:MAG: MFS transporter [Candidatus Hydrogenedentes bacterium]|nr:MFS transporter [Candidatus Hydrogenedentota bacterium]
MLLKPHHRMYAAAFLLDFSVAIALTALPFFIFERLGGGPAMSGAVGAFQMAIYAAGCLLSARYVTGARSGLYLAIIGVAAFALPFTLIPWMTSPLVCGVATSLPFFGLALAWPAMQSWLGGEPDPEARARHLTGFNTATAFGFTFSPLFAGPLYDFDYRLPFFLLFVVGVVVVLLLRSLPKEVRVAESNVSGDADDSEADTFSPGLLYASWGATLSANSLFAALRSVYPSRVETLVSEGNLDLWSGWQPAWLLSVGPATAFSWLAFILPLATVASFTVLGRTKSWRGRFDYMVAGQLIAAASLIALAHTHSVGMMLLCFIAVGANYGLCFFSSLYYSLAVASEKHRRAAINEGLLGVGAVLGGIGTGYAAGAIGLTAAFQWTPVAVMVAVAVQVWLLRR